MSTQINFLEEIIGRKRLRLEQAKAKRPIEDLRARAIRVRGGRESHALQRAIAADGPTKVIAEIKRASPSKGLISKNLDPRQQARAYQQGGASIISVITEEDSFLGSLDDLRTVLASSTLPVLRKDFLFDSYQIYETAEAGADALLLIVAALDDAKLRELLRLAQDELGMDALVEVHTADEMRRAINCGARIIGVNNRNLRTFEVSLDVSVELAREAGRILNSQGKGGEGASDVEPAHSREVFLVSESGLSKAADLRRLQAVGFRAFLIGETLMRAENPEAMLRKLIRDTDRVRVKVCGITNLADAQLCVSEGVDILGFNFYRGSPRYIAPQEVRRIVDQLPSEVCTVGVFVNEEPEDVIQIVAQAGIDAVQLHGDESVHFCRDLSELFVIKALRVNDNFSPEIVASYQTAAVLLDAFSADARGGTGRRFDWNIARETKRFASKLFLAGGLTPENVGEAISSVEPYAVDVCSSLESTPGIKREDRLKEFMKAVRGRQRREG